MNGMYLLKAMEATAMLVLILNRLVFLFNFKYRNFAAPPKLRPYGAIEILLLILLLFFFTLGIKDPEGFGKK